MTQATRRRTRLVIDVKRSGSGWVCEWRGFGRREEWPVKEMALESALEDARDHEALGGLAQVVIHRGRDNRIQEERTFGADPRRRVG